MVSTVTSLLGSVRRYGAVLERDPDDDLTPDRLDTPILGLGQSRHRNLAGCHRLGAGGRGPIPAVGTGLDCPLLGSNLLLNALATPPAGLLKRRLQQKRLAVIETLASTAAALVACGAAISGLGYWALVSNLRLTHLYAQVPCSPRHDTHRARRAGPRGAESTSVWAAMLGYVT